MSGGLFEPLGPWFFDPLPIRHFNFLAIDPPWNFALYSEEGAEKSAARHYDCMSDVEIRGLPVGDLADENCLMYLWATAPQLPLAISCVEAWGFTYKSFLIWRKVSVNGKVLVGTGYRVRTTAEIVVVATKGDPVQSYRPHTVFDGIRREHSRKPEEFYALCEKVMPRARRADVFSREKRPGWMSWGNEAGLFNGEVGPARQIKPKTLPLIQTGMFDEVEL